MGRKAKGSVKPLIEEEVIEDFVDSIGRGRDADPISDEDLESDEDSETNETIDEELDSEDDEDDNDDDDDDLDIIDSEDAEEAVETKVSAPLTKHEKKSKKVSKPKATEKTTAAETTAPDTILGWTPSIAKGIPIPLRKRSGPWIGLASKLEVGCCIENVASRKHAVAITAAVKKLGGTAVFRKLDSGLFGVWRTA